MAVASVNWFGVACNLAFCGCALVIVGQLSVWLRTVWAVLRMRGPAAVPLLGNALLIRQHGVLQRIGSTAYSLYGPVFRIWALLIPMVVVLDPPDVQAVLSTHKHTDKIYFYRLLHNFLGEGLITSSGDSWKTQRRVLQPTFHLSVLETFVGTFADSAKALVQRLACVPPGPRNIAPEVNQCVIDILNEAVLGIPVPEHKPVAQMETSPFRKGQVVMPDRLLKPWLLFNWLYSLTDLAKRELQQKKALNEFATKILRERKIMKKNAKDNNGSVAGHNHKPCLLDHMLDIADKTGALSEDDIVTQVCTFMLAGQDSVGSAVAFCLFLLAKHPTVQKRAVDELDEIFGEDSRTPTRHDVGRMRYLEQCVKEALRLYPSVPMIARRLDEDVVMGKHTIPAGCNVILAPFATHRLEHIFPDPETFNPDRFSAENSVGRHPYAFIPFSAGPRNCIGYKFAMLEMKTVIATVLRHFHLEAVKGKDELTLTYRITIRASGGIWVSLTPRNK